MAKERAATTNTVGRDTRERKAYRTSCTRVSMVARVGCRGTMCRRHFEFVYVRKSRGGCPVGRPASTRGFTTFLPFIGISYSSLRLLRETMGHMAKHRRPAKF